MLSENSSKPPSSINDNPPWGVPSSILVMVLAEFAALVSVLLIGGFFSLLQAAKGLKPDFEDITLNFVFLLVSTMVMLAVVVAFVLIRKGKMRSLGLVKTELSSYFWVLPGFGIYLAALLVGFKLVEILFPGIDLDQLQDISFLNASGSLEMILAFVSLIIIAPIAEEIAFRGFLFGGLRKRLGLAGAAVVSALIFALVHGQLNVGIDTFLLGLVLAWLYHKTKSIWPAVLLHAIKNSIAFYLLFFVDK